MLKGMWKQAEQTTDVSGGDEERRKQSFYAEIVERVKEVPAIVGKQTAWTYRAMKQLGHKPDQIDEYTKPIVFRMGNDPKEWNNPGFQKVTVVKANGDVEEGDPMTDSSEGSSDLMAPGVPKTSMIRNRKLPKQSTYASMPAVPPLALSSASSSDMTMITKRQRADLGGQYTPREHAVTPRPAPTDSDPIRQSMFRADAKFEIQSLPFGEGTNQLLKDVDVAMNSPDMQGRMQNTRMSHSHSINSRSYWRRRPR